LKERIKGQNPKVTSLEEEEVLKEEIKALSSVETIFP
jgi:hypothetical protein